MRIVRTALVATLIAMTTASADVLPPRPEPPPPPPSGPSKAIIRGLAVEQVYGRRRDRWTVMIRSCTREQPGCHGLRPGNCIVTAVEGRELAGGDIAALVAAADGSSAAQLKLRLDGDCGLRELSLVN